MRGGDGGVGRSFERALKGGIPEGYRNAFTWNYALYSKIIIKKEPEAILSELEGAFSRFEQGSCAFTLNELRKTVASACRERYQYVASRDKLAPLFASILGLAAAACSVKKTNETGAIVHAVSNTDEAGGDGKEAIPPEIKASLARCLAKRALGRGFPMVPRPENERHALNHLEWVRLRRLAYEKKLH